MAYQSPEQIAATVLVPLGFKLVNRTLLPFRFTDKDGNAFQAMADFYHEDLDIWVEIKANHLNGKTSKVNAERAYNRIETSKLQKYPTYYQTRHQWNHAAPKQALVQSTIGAPQYVIAFTQHPDDETLTRLTKQGIQAYSLARFASMFELQLACSKNDGN
jgi:hypothetical protein